MKKSLKRTSLLIAILFIVFIIFSIKVNADTSNARNLFDAEKLSDNNIAILFAKGNEKNLYLGTYNPSNNNWVEIPVGNTAPIAKEAALAIHNDKAHVVYITSDDKMNYLYQTETGWSEVTVFTSANANGSWVSTDALSCPDIVVDNNGKVHISYVDTDGAGDEDSRQADGMYATNETGTFVITAPVSCTGYREAYGMVYDSIVKPLKLSVGDNGRNLSYIIYNYDGSSGSSGVFKSYDFYFLSTQNLSLHTNNGGKIFDTLADGEHYYTLVCHSGNYFVVDGNTKIAETEKTFTIKSADMTLDSSNLYYAAINGTDLLFYQNGTFVEGKTATTALSSNTNLVTLVVNGTQYILYTGNDEDNSLVISKLDNDEISEYLIPNGIKTWSELQAALSAGGDVVLTQDIVAESTDTTLVITREEATLDLNGYIIDAKGYFTSVISVETGCTFTLNDSNPTKEHSPNFTYKNPLTSEDVVVNGGIITGGTNGGWGHGINVTSGTLIMNGGSIVRNITTRDNGTGVVIYNGTTYTMSGAGVFIHNGSTFTMNGGLIAGNYSIGNGGGVSLDYDNTFNMNGGTIKHNTADGDGGGVYLWNDQPGLNETFNMSGGRIEENKSTGNGGGICITDRGVLNLSGYPVIIGNKKDDTNNNVYGSVGINSALTNGALVGITTKQSPITGGTQTFTSGYNTYNNGDDPANYFISDIEKATVTLNDQSEACLKRLFDVTITADENGTATADITSGVEGTEVTLTASPNDAEKYKFKEWEVVSGGGIVIRDNKFNIGNSDVEIKAVFDAKETYNLYVGNTQITSINKNDVLGDGKITYNPTTNTLTLNGATITGGGNDEEGYGIKYLGNTDLNIVANGTNVVSDTGNRRNGSAGLLVGGTIGEYTPNYDLSNYHANVNITINEGASLTFNGGTTLSDYYPSSYGICLWQNDGNVAVTGKGNLGLNGGSSKYSYGIYIPDTLTLNTEGNVEVNTADGSYYAVGIQAGNIVINDGTVNINNANTENASVALSTDGASYNNDTRGNITINNGSVHVVGGTITDSSGKSYGVYSDKTINVNGGSLEASTVATTGTAMAVNITPTIPDGTNAAANTEPSIVGSVKYNPDNNSSYKYYKIPATIYTVTFETYGGGTVASQEIVSGEKATEPSEIPSRDGYTFFGWCSDAEMSTAFDFSHEITSNKTVYAGYKKEVWVDNTTDDSEATIIGEVKLTDLADNTETTTKLFDETIGTNYITPMSDEVISKINSAKSTCETYISNNGYTNKGTENNTEENRKWDHRIYPDSVESYSSEEKSILRTHIASGSYGKEMTYTTTVYAEYDSRPLYTVTFKDGDSTITTQEVREGENASKPTDPTKDEYKFMGWYADSGFNTEFNFNDTTITDNTSIYAKYVKMIPVYRMYNPNSGEHLYTTDAYEVKIIFEQQGWGKEGIAWYTSEEGTPVYRLYNPRLGNHLYTSDTYEISVITRTQGWVLDFDGAPVMFAKGDIPVYRLFNPGLQGQHHLTTDLNEYRVIPKWGWQQEGIAMKVLSIGVPQTTHYYKK